MFGRKNTAAGRFGPTRARPWWRAGAALAALAVQLQLLAHACITQWLASRLDFQEGLGTPLLRIGRTPFYPPLSHMHWVERLRETDGAQRLLELTGCLAVIGPVAAALVTIFVAVQAIRGIRNRIDVLHGSQAYGTKSELERAGLLGTEGAVIAHWRDGRKLRVLYHNGPEGVLCFAPPRSGKGIGPVQSTLLSWTHSALVLDPKGENFAFTSGWRVFLGQRIYYLNFAAAPHETAGFNPLDTVRLGTPSEVADAQRLAQMIVDPDGKQAEGQNAHWAETAAALLTGAILHVLYRERCLGALGTLKDVADELTDPRRTHSQVLNDWLSFPHDPDQEQGWTDGGELTSTHPVVVAASREQLNREEREQTAVLSSTVAKLALFRDPRVATNTSHSSFALEDLMSGEVPVTVYLVMSPADIKRLRPLVRVFIDCTMRRLTERMDFEDGKRKAQTHRLLLMLDEFPILGNMSVFTETFAYCAGYGIMPYLIAQDYEQVRATYGDRETISSSCNIWTAYAPNKLETAQMLSARLGKTTISVRTRRESKQTSAAEQQVGRDLRDPTEIMRLKPARKVGDQIVEAGEMLVFFQGVPVMAEQPLFFLNPALRGRRDGQPAPRTPEPWDAEAFLEERHARARRLARLRSEQADQNDQPGTPASAPVTGRNADGSLPSPLPTNHG